MPFRFSLDSLLRFRISRERAEQLKLETIVAEQSQIRAWIRNLEDAASEIRAAFQRSLANGVGTAELQLEAARQANFNTAGHRLRDRLAEAEQRRRVQVEAFVRARRDREVLEDLRRRRLRAFGLREARREQQELDDLFRLRRGAE